MDKDHDDRICLKDFIQSNAYPGELFKQNRIDYQYNIEENMTQTQVNEIFNTLAWYENSWFPIKINILIEIDISIFKYTGCCDYDYEAYRHLHNVIDCFSFFFCIPNYVLNRPAYLKEKNTSMCTKIMHMVEGKKRRGGGGERRENRV